MKKLLVPILFLLCLLNSCSDNVEDDTGVADFEAVENIENTGNCIFPDTIEQCDITSAIYDLEAESEPILNEMETSAEVQETVLMPETVQADVSKSFVYLTLDDGPGKHTECVLEILDEYDVPATFFMVGRYMKTHPDNVKAVYEAGHLIGCHSVSHDYRVIFKDAQAITDDIKAWENIFFETVGTKPDDFLYRFPGGSTCSAIEEGRFTELHAAVLSLGYRSFDWTCANNDLYRVNMNKDDELTDFLKHSLKESLKRCGQPKIVLVHETVAETVEMLPWIIEYIRGEGYEFAPLDMLEEEYIFAH